MTDFATILLDQNRIGTLISNIAALTKGGAAAQYSIADMEVRLDLLESYWEKFAEQDILLQREANNKKDSPYFVQDHYNQGLSLYLQAKGWFKQNLRPPAGATPESAPLSSLNSATAGGITTGPHSSQSALEKVRLPRFNGNRRDWEAFKERFTSLIVDDPTIAPVIKLQHLMNCLEGEPVQRLRGIQQNAANFSTAWDSLCRRYDNFYLRFKAQMQVLASIPAAKEETEAHLSLVVNTIDESINVFKVLHRPVDHWDDILIYFAESKLSPETKKDWAKEVEQKGLTTFPKYADLKRFLEGRLDTLDVVDMYEDGVATSDETACTGKVEKSGRNGKRYYNKRGKSTSVHLTTQGKNQERSIKCSFCQGDHFLSHCSNFVRISQEEKKAHVTTAGLCFNCLRTGHKLSACTSKNRCFVCGEVHHTKLHGISSGTSTATATTASAQESVSVHAMVNQATCQAVTGAKGVLLTTACVTLEAPSGHRITVRALLDSGAEDCLISERVCQALNLKGDSVNVVVTGIGAATAKTRVSAVLRSDYSTDFCLRFSALVLRRLTSVVPSKTVTLPPWLEFKGLKLADPNLHLPRRIDCILDSGVFAAALLPGMKPGPCGTLALTNSVSRLWELEEVPKKTPLSPDEQRCYSHFKETHSRTKDGRFVVRLPFVKSPVLKDTRRIAEGCLQRLERRLQRDSALAAAYTEFLEEYRNLQHLEIVPDSEIECNSAYYLPHHPVFKSDGSGKIRVVFNASQCDDDGNSLNTFLHTGSKLQEDVFIIILCWRFLRVVFKCDIVKMFRQYLLHRKDTDWQRILWSFSKGLMQTIRLLTVTYGTGSAPFLANACLLQLAEDEAERYPRGARVIKKGRYVDDFFSGADDVEEATLVRDELIGILGSAGMQVGKWASNRLEVLPGSEDIVAVGMSGEQEDTVSALGLCWISSEDAFCFKIKEITNDSIVTKRVILSAIARLYDPVGWLHPFTIRPKILLQQLWLRGVDWDTPVPSDLLQAWIQFKNQLSLLESIRIPRWFGTTTTSEWQLHAFCDASERAYAAALYIVHEQDEGFVSHLMAAKAKVAPLKIISLPRLELCGAGLLAALVSYILPTLPKQPQRIHCWSDSKVALSWIVSHPSRWKTFVANRVSDIHDKLPGAKWRHVRSAENPADLATRGLSSEQLQGAELWWKGPDWLCRSEASWPLETDSDLNTDLEEKRTLVHCVITEDVDEDLSRWFERYSSFGKLLRHVAQIIRWKRNSGLQEAEKKRGWLTAQELELGRCAIFKVVQAQVYRSEIKDLLKHGFVHRSSSLSRLSPFIDQLGVLRVGGRLQNSFLSESEVHPVILPNHHHVTVLIVEEAHLLTLHGGPTIMQSYLTRRYWIVRSRNFIRSIARRCVRCTRLRAVPLEQMMGPIPAYRTAPARPFSHTGVDYAGPFLIKASQGRGQKCYKGYVAVFVCMVVRAVHLEVVSDYTSAAFLAAFRRFAGRRGTPSHLYSDNGTNFKGAEAELRRLFAESSAISQEVAMELAKGGTEWRFSPPRAPNFGGLWEASVKAFKHHFKRVIGEQKLTFEELETLTTCIEACLNSRPLNVKNPCEEDSTVLTPGHFLIGDALTAPPEPFIEINEQTSVCSRWKRVCLMRNHFWKRWHRECLVHMQERAKWLRPSTDFKVGDIVLFKDTLMPPTKWPLAKIVKLHYGVDGLSRVAVIRTASAEYKRPVNKLIMLPINEKAND